MSIGSRFKPIYWTLMQQPALVAADCLHATSEAECEDIRRLGLRTPVAIIPNGVTIPAEAERPPFDQRSILYLGRLHPEKGLVTLLQAWEQVEAKLDGWILRLVGPDPVGHRAQLEKLAHKVGLCRVSFDGPVVGESKWRLLEKAELVVLPSPSENFGIVVAEALGAAVPVIATTGTPWAEVVERRAGWRCGKKAEDIAYALLRATSTHYIERRQMGQRGRDWMRTSYGWEKIGELMCDTYRWVLHGGAVPPWIDRDRCG